MLSSAVYAKLSTASHTVTSIVTVTADSQPPNTASAATSSGIATATPVTNYAVPAPSDVSSVSFNCQDGVIQESTFYKGAFEVYCGTDFGGPSASTSTDSNGSALNYVDILGLLVYSSSSCMQACLELNYWGDLLGRPSPEYCRAIHFSAELSSALSENGANCWLKNGTPADAGSFPVGDPTTGLSATLNQN